MKKIMLVLVAIVSIATGTFAQIKSQDFKRAYVDVRQIVKSEAFPGVRLWTAQVQEAKANNVYNFICLDENINGFLDNAKEKALKGKKNYALVLDGIDIAKNKKNIVADFKKLSRFANDVNSEMDKIKSAKDDVSKKQHIVDSLTLKSAPRASIKSAQADVTLAGKDVERAEAEHQTAKADRAEELQAFTEYLDDKAADGFAWLVRADTIPINGIDTQELLSSLRAKDSGDGQSQNRSHLPFWMQQQNNSNSTPPAPNQPTQQPAAPAGTKGNPFNKK